MTVTLYAPRFDPMTKDILRKAKEVAELNTRIRLVTDLEVAKGSPNLLTLGRFKELPHGTALPSPPQLKSKGSSLSTLVWMLKSSTRSSTRQGQKSLSLSTGIPSKGSSSMSPATPSYSIATTRKEVQDYLDSLLSEHRGNRQRRLSLDIETHGDIDVLHPVERPLVSVAVFDGEHAVVIPRMLLGPADYQGSDQAWPVLLEYLAKFDLELHNALFDLPTLCSRLALPGVAPESYGLRVGFDTMLTHYIIRPAAEQGLKPVAKSALGLDDWDHFTKEDMGRLGEMPEDEVYLYNAYDVVHTWGLRDFLEPLRDHTEGAIEASKHLHDFANGIMWDQLDGFPVDTGRATELCNLLSKEIAERKKQLIEWAHSWVEPSEFPSKQFNPGSPKQVKKVYASVGHPLPDTSAKTMEKLVERGDQFAKELLAYRSVGKEYSTYAKKAKDEHNPRVHGEPRLYPWYNLTSTLTGRLSSSGVTNIQNWPKQEEFTTERQLRSVFRTTSLADYRLIQVDYSQAELRVMAAVSGDDWLTGIFSDPTLDIFTQMTRDIFPHIKDPKEIKLWRRPLKAVVYGLAFGRQAPAIALELGIPVMEAQAIMDGFLTRADELDTWRRWIMRESVTGGDLITRFGRHFQHEIVTPRNRAAVQRSALSFIPQSTASDLTLKAYNGLRSWVKEHDKAWYFRAVVHDALTYDVPEHEVGEAMEVISHFMVEAAQEIVPEVPFAVDGNSAELWALTG